MGTRGSVSRYGDGEQRRGVVAMERWQMVEVVEIIMGLSSISEGTITMKGLASNISPLPTYSFR